MAKLDLNADMGESFGVYRYGADEDMMPYISSANVACGFHAGDPAVMHRTVQLAKRHGVKIGAHISVPDLLGFGRRYMKISANDARDYTLYQMGALSAIVRSEGVELNHVKLHGSFYMMTLEDKKLAQAVAGAIARFNNQLWVFTVQGSEMEQAANGHGLRVAREFFADRPYYRGTGVKMFGWEIAEIGDSQSVADRVRSLVDTGMVNGADGFQWPFTVDTICVHADTPQAPAIIRAVHQQLVQAGVDLRAPEA